MRVDVPQADGTDASPNGHENVADLRDIARGSLRLALHAKFRARPVDGEVRELMRRACDMAQAQGTHVERLVILLKEAWHELPEARMNTSAEAHETLANLVTLCIEEYYTPRPT